MFHRDCYQILLLNFRSSTEAHTSILPQKRFLHVGGGGGGGGGGWLLLHNNDSQILALGNSQFFKRRN